ncbi:unnamed protein product [Schistosoma curassoni]|uniref:Secreted protein n=1 Tax=Schistosoma curassoni TaxID=6186 RepID=A0A183KMR0_9TREM|nr:unnamed protein product [Schistosoma curassoni]
MIHQQISLLTADSFVCLMNKVIFVHQKSVRIFVKMILLQTMSCCWIRDLRYTFGGVNVHQTLNRNYLYKLLNFIKVIYVRCNRNDQDNLSLQ